MDSDGTGKGGGALQTWAQTLATDQEHSMHRLLEKSHTFKY